jgi:histidine triad (HIT) family protein
MKSCVFCRIALHEAHANIIYEDDNVIAFLDVCPANEGHALVVPKRHYENMFDTPDDILASVISVSKKVGQAQKKALAAEAVNLVNASGKEAGQDIFHFHMHVIPRHSNDGINERDWWKPKKSCVKRWKLLQVS